jgi:hypothetical protein
MIEGWFWNLQHTFNNKMLARQLEGRYRSIHEVHTNLRELLEGSKSVQGVPRIVRVSVALLLVVIVSFAIWWFTGKQAPSVQSGEIKSIAVLPLDNLTNDSEQDYFVEGMHDSLIRELSRISSLRVRISAKLVGVAPERNLWANAPDSVTKVNPSPFVWVSVEGEVTHFLQVSKDRKFTSEVITQGRIDISTHALNQGSNGQVSTSRLYFFSTCRNRS